MITSKTGKYASRRLPASADTQGMYFSDALVDSFLAANRSLANHPQPPVPAPMHFTLEQSRALIEAALSDFDPSLGRRAKEIFDAGFDDAVKNSRASGFQIDWTTLDQADSRWRIEQVPTGLAKMMRSLDAQSPESAYGPANPNHRSVIDYQFDGTFGGAAYLAHELGHGIADDCAREKSGGNPVTTPLHMQETRAYFTQHILYDYIARNPELEKTYPGITNAGHAHRDDAMTQNLAQLSLSAKTASVVDALPPSMREHTDEQIERLHGRPMAILTAGALVVHAREQNEKNRAWTAEAVLGRHGPMNACQVLSAAGIECKTGVAQFAKKAAALLEPVPDTAIRQDRKNNI